MAALQLLVYVAVSFAVIIAIASTACRAEELAPRGTRGTRARAEPGALLIEGGVSSASRRLHQWWSERHIQRRAHRAENYLARARSNDGASISIEPGPQKSARKSGNVVISTPSSYASSSLDTYVTLVMAHAKCVLQPTFGLNDLSGGCNIFHPFRPFWKASNITVDRSKCQATLDKAMSVVRQPLESRVTLQTQAVSLRRKTTDCFVAMQVFCQGDANYLPHIARFMPADGRAVTFLDAGANIGLVTSLFADFLGGRGEVLAVEAAPGTFELLQRNTAHHGAAVTRVQGALVSQVQANAAPTVVFGGREKDYWGLRVQDGGPRMPENNAEEQVEFEVPALSLVAVRDMARSGHLDFIKMDIEGAENSILGDSASRTVLCAAYCVFLELHDRFAPGGAAALSDLLETGCAGSQFFRQPSFGEYEVLCKQAVD